MHVGGLQMVLNKPDYNMSEYALVTLNRIEYTGTYLRKQIVEYARINLNVSDAVHSIRTVQYTEQLPRQTYSDYCQTFKMEHIGKRIMLECRCTTRNFSGEWGRVVELDTSINISSKTREKETRQGNILDFFLLDTLKTTF